MVAKTSNRWIVGLTGRNASGKGETARLLEARGYVYRSLSDALREEAKRRNITPSRENLIALGRDLRQTEGAGVLATRSIEALTEDCYVIDSIRNIEEIRILRGTGDFILLAVDAPIELRYERAQQRGREENAKTLDEFRRLEDLERAGGPLAQQLDACLKDADATIHNAGSLEELEAQLDQVLTQKGYPVQSK